VLMFHRQVVQALHAAQLPDQALQH
jgi:hypothetical protein